MSSALRTAILRALERSKLGDLARVSGLPFMEPRLPPFLSYAPRRMDSDIDPRLILGGGALGALGAGALTAEGIQALRPVEEQAMREKEWFEDADTRTQDLMRRVRALRSG